LAPGGTNVAPLALHDAADQHLLHFRVFPVSIFSLAVVILLVNTHRTRRFIAEAFEHAQRAATLSRHFSPEVAEELTSRPQEAATFGERMEVAVLFADLRGFTAMSEAMEPAELARFLSEFRSRIARPVVAHGGVVDKYIGDGVMVVFGAPKSGPDDAQRALACAQSMVHAIEAWSGERVRQGRSPVAVGIGGHFGKAFAGVLSDGQLLEYTVIGDTVNVASRLSRLPRLFDTALVVSEALVEAAGGLPEPARWERLPPQRLPGHPRDVSVFALRLAQVTG
jgi:adenylate cyclase